MRSAIRIVPRRNGARAFATKARPPEPRPYKPAALHEKPPPPPTSTPAQKPIEELAATATNEVARLGLKPAPKKRYVSPFSKLAFEDTDRGERDPQRGLEAAKRYVREGVVDPRYKADGRRVTALMCALPVAIVTSYYLWQRRFGDDVQKPIPAVRTTRGEQLITEDELRRGSQ